jgi:hypothetical protein
LKKSEGYFFKEAQAAPVSYFNIDCLGFKKKKALKSLTVIEKSLPYFIPQHRGRRWPDGCAERSCRP